MELKMECIRATMKYLEEYTGVFNNDANVMEYFEVGAKKIMKELSQNNGLEPDDIFYTLLKLREAGFIKADIHTGAKNEIMILTVTDITWAGHEFLKTISNDSIWKQVVDVCKKLGIFSVKGIAQISIMILNAYITKAASYIDIPF